MNNANTSLREKNIVFIGFMGVGKTTVGKLVAQKLYRSFIDIDKEIEEKYNMSIPQIFEKVGEKAFREEEKNLVKQYCSQKLKVISLGGGAFLQEEIRKICLDNSIVFALDISWDSWKNRLHMLIDSRPVLQNKSATEIEELFYKRQKSYSYHHSKVFTDNLEAEAVADYIIEALKTSWELYD
jgi:shikimate kinase